MLVFLKFWAAHPNGIHPGGQDNTSIVPIQE